jgi:hypothetical protein
LPFLLQHYRHHKNGQPSISVISFLKLHYSDTHPGDNDGRRITSCRFKSMINLIHTDIPIVNKEVKLDPAYPKNIDKPASSYSEDIPNSPAFQFFIRPVCIVHLPLIMLLVSKTAADYLLLNLQS